jgi:hypothetical protein
MKAMGCGFEDSEDGDASLIASDMSLDSMVTAPTTGVQSLHRFSTDITYPHTSHIQHLK